MQKEAARPMDQLLAKPEGYKQEYGGFPKARNARSALRIRAERESWYRIPDSNR